jgi:UDP-N-acetylglucosamine 2-epimerase (non-hydrolysing)
MIIKNIMAKFKENGKLKLLIIVGTRPEIIRLAAVINKCRQYFDCLLAHTGQNYDYNLNGVFFKDLKLADPDVYMEAVGNDLGETMGNIIAKSYQLMVEVKPDAVLVLGDTNSCLSVIGAKRLHIPIFHMEAGNRCKDECLPEETNRRIVDIISDVNMAYSEHARRYLADTGLPKERTYVTGSPMAEVLHNNLAEIEASDIHKRLGLEKGKYILLSAHREENIDTEKNFLSLFNAINKMAEKYDMPILYSCHPRSRKRLEASGFQLDKRVIQHEPLGFHDYNCLQMNAFAVVSDSGTLPEESSFFTSVGHPFPAVCIRTSTERPEALDKGCFVLSGIDTVGLLQSVDVAVSLIKDGHQGIPVPDYVDENVSTKVVRIIQSYVGVVNKMVWRKF